MRIIGTAVVAGLSLLLPGTAPAQADQLAWHKCSTGPEDEVGTSLDAAGAQCAELQVPLNYSAPNGRKITLAIARRSATDTAHKQGTLVVNVGGPEASRQGVTWFLDKNPSLAAKYDVVGIDPRFFGRSTPLECGYPTNLYLQSVQYGSPTRVDFQKSTAVARDLAARCAPYKDLLPYASTRNIARDLDVVREQLGVPRLSYFGVSYGTYLGAVYLQMFPDHADRFVLDSAHAPDNYGPNWTRETAPADAAALADWAGWAAQRNAQYRLGTTRAAVLAAVDRIAAATRRGPVQVGTHQVTAAMLPGLLLTVDDTDASYAEFSAQVRVLRDAAAGLVVTPTPSQEQRFQLYDLTDVIPEFSFSANTANQCADRATSRDPETYYRDIQAHRTTEPLYGPLARDINPCAFWPTSPVEQPTTIANSRPALILSASGDPALPYPGQLAMHHALRGSRLITLQNSYRHGVYGASPCADTPTNNYLSNGHLPPRDLTC
ncbi:alpha/beta fold hydrolase [Kribbella solani]|uniref:alpha/beta hydrolase n=1 Tax=Kribbella solani TaxID=236067 RepID=UPI0029AE6442|nr:alpha/beta fold hydrolase [Kribbella solani]MDX2971994.1 alpha/beta fold hydrolase [Kribbella solani]MDX3005000.1 alpha/beta fold hydrolase [Kribbella solani]